jgi:hypothetical protein
LTSFAQGEKMTNSDFNIIDSILEVKASGVDLHIEQDLSLPEGKSIAQLLYDQENQEVPQNPDHSA